MARLDDVCNTLIAQITNAVNAAGVPGSTFINQKTDEEVTVQGGQVERGYPPISEIANILAPGDGNWQIFLFPFKPRRNTRTSPWDKQNQILTPPSVPVSVVRTATTLTFLLTGSISSPVNIHTVFGSEDDAFVQATTGATTDTIATAVCNAINALDLAGTSATVAGNVVTITSTLSFVCNIGGTGTLAYMAGQFIRPIQVSIWASDPYTRSMLQEAIEENVGTTLTPNVLLPDGSNMRVVNDDVGWDDDSQADGSLYIGHAMLTVWYAIMTPTPIVTVGAVKAITTGPKSDSGTFYAGGSS